MRKFLRSIATIITAAIAFLLVMIVASTYINPGKIHVLAFLGYIFPVVYILNIIMLFYWLVKLKKQLLIPLIAAVFSWTQWENTFQWRGRYIDENDNSGNLIKVMTFNVKMFDVYKWIGRKGVAEGIFEYIRKENPDIVCLQEFYSNNRTNEFSENHILTRLRQYPYWYFGYKTSNSKVPRSGLAIFSKFPITGKQSLRFENTSNLTIQTDIRIKGVTIRLFNNHLESMRLSKQDIDVIDKMQSIDGIKDEKNIKHVAYKISNAFNRRATQANLIDQHVTNSPYPVIVCGDFNDTPVSYVYRKMRGDLKDAFVEAGKGFGGTYNGPLPSFRIDYILFDPSFEAYNFNRDDIVLSDHFPVITILDISGYSSAVK